MGASHNPYWKQLSVSKYYYIVTLKHYSNCPYSLLRCVWLWGTASVYFGVTYIWLITIILPLYAMCHQYRYLFFIDVKNIIWRTKTKSKKFYVGLKLEWGLWDKYWSSWKHLQFEVFFSCLFDVLLGVTYANILVATQWPVKRAPDFLFATQWPLKHRPHLQKYVWYRGLEAHWSCLHYVGLWSFNHAVSDLLW